MKRTLALSVLLLSSAALFSQQAAPKPSPVVPVPAITPVTAPAPSAAATPATTPGAPQLSPIEDLQLQVTIRDGVILKLQSQLANLESASKTRAFEDWKPKLAGQLEELRKQHNWGPDVQFDYNTLKFTRNGVPEATSNK